jgi:hypothetical protein
VLKGKLETQIYPRFFGALERLLKEHGQEDGFMCGPKVWRFLTSPLCGAWLTVKVALTVVFLGGNGS